MVSLRVLSVCLLAASLICAADSNAVKQAAALVEQRSAKAPEALRAAFRKLARNARPTPRFTWSAFRKASYSIARDGWRLNPSTCGRNRSSWKCSRAPGWNSFRAALPAREGPRQAQVAA